MRSPFPRLARSSLIVAALCMGAALLATVWTTNRGVNDASSMLVRGQSTVLLDKLRARLSVEEGQVVDLDAVLAGMTSDGLRWVALLDDSGAIQRQAGRPATSATPEQLLALAIGVPAEAGDRARVVLRRPDRRGVPREPEPARRRGPTPIAIEFEPTAARELLASGRRTLLLGAFAAVGFLAIAIWLLWWFLKQARLERALEHERRLAALGRMSAVLAHEIRNPLASLKGNAQLLERALPADDRSRKKAELLVSEAVRLETLVSDLLEFARAGELQVSEVDPGALARDAAAAAGSERIELIASAAPKSWPLDATKMRQVLINLLENALQSSDAPVTARVARERDALLFEVCDRGPGIKAEDLPRVFEPFFTRRTRGTGLGLAICKRLVELHGGSIAASNGEQGGARFMIRIPREAD